MAAVAVTIAASTVARAQGLTCVIKGNISSNGERIYHLPGQRYYDKTQIDTGHGERWFCTKQDAIAAGWRKAGL
jgi:hypothetical protein